MTRFYEPYQGKKFRKNPNLLILSESAYGWLEEGAEVLPDEHHPRRSTVEYWSLERFDAAGREGRYPKWLTRALCNSQAPDLKLRVEAWNAVAYSIYVQRPMHSKAERPTKTDFDESGEAFLELLNMLRPQRVLVTSLASWNHMPKLHVMHPTDHYCGAYRLAAGELCWCLAVPHQRSRRMGWQLLGETIQHFLAEDLGRV